MKSTQTLAVDLDGTLTLTDTLHESILVLIRNKPFSLFSLPFWLIKGIAFLKLKVAESCELDVTTLPYNLPFIDWLKEQKDSGRKIVLCSAANERVAIAVSEHLNLFDDVIASDASINLKSVKKRKALEDRFGDKGYDYAGNSKADLEVWAGAQQAIVVNASELVGKEAQSVAIVSKVFPPQAINFKHWRRVFRAHHWIKNFLLFVPLLAAHQFGNIHSLSSLLLAFVSFSLCASAVYIANDLFDLDNDRKHPRKRYRPFAAAVVPIKYGVAIIPILAIISLALGLMVGSRFVAWLIGYFVLTTAYSLRLKRYVLIDCLTLASLYTMRIIAGAAAVAISLSFWLLAFSAFIFLSLAFVKRYAELQVQEQAGNNDLYGRGYKVTDAPLVKTLGITAGYVAVLVLALYLNSETVIRLYAQPEMISFAVPIVLFWVSWIWIKAHRGEMHDDPIVFALKDRTSQVLAICLTCVYLLAI